MAWVDVETPEVESGWVDVEETPEYVKETPTAVEVDPFLEAPVPEEGTVMPEEGGGTATPYEMQTKQVQQFESDEEADVSKTLAEIQQAVSTAADQLGFTEDSEQAMARYNKEATRVLTEKGYRVETRGDQKVIVGQQGKEYPFEPGVLDSIIASKGEMLGAMGAGIATGTAAGAAGGAIAGPVGATVGGGLGGLVGGVAGAIKGDEADVLRHAEKYGIEITPEELADRRLEVGLGEVVGTAVGGTIGKAIGKLFTKSAIKEFTSLADLPKNTREKVATLQKTTGLSDEQMEANIKQYASTIEGKLPESEAVKAASQGSYKEQTGFLYKAALRSSDAKNNLISEIDDRSKQIADAFSGDDELMGIYTKHTKTDKDRSATNWKGLHDDLVKAGVTEDEPIMETIKRNSDTFDKYEKDLFTALVSPDSAEAKNLIEGVGFRSNPKGQGYAVTLSLIKGAYDSMFGDNVTAVKAINKALSSRATKPKKLEQELIEAGVETNRAREAVAKVEADRIRLKEAEEAKVTKATEAKEKAFEKVIAKDEKTGSAMEAGIDKDVTEFKKTKTAMQKEKKVEEVKLAKESKEELKMQKESMKRAGIDWDEANLDATVSKKDKARLKEARRRAQMDAVPMGTSDADTAVAKIQQEILDKKQAVADRKAKLDVLKQEAEKPSAMEAGIKKKTRKPTPNQVEAQKLKEADPDNKEAIKKALIKKSPEVQAKKTAEEGVAKEAMEKENYTSSKKSLKKKVNTVEDMDNLKEVTRNPNSTEAERVESRRRRRAVASREAFGSDDLAVKYKEWGDDSRSGFGDFIVEKKDELNLDYEQVKKYYEVQGDAVPTKVKKAYTAKAMKAGIKARDYTKELGEEGNKAYNAWASKVRGNAKEGSSPNVSLSKFKRSADGKPYRGE